MLKAIRDYIGDDKNLIQLWIEDVDFTSRIAEAVFSQLPQQDWLPALHARYRERQRLNADVDSDDMIREYTGAGLKKIKILFRVLQINKLPQSVTIPDIKKLLFRDDEIKLFRDDEIKLFRDDEIKLFDTDLRIPVPERRWTDLLVTEENKVYSFRLNGYSDLYFKKNNNLPRPWNHPDWKMIVSSIALKTLPDDKKLEHVGMGEYSSLITFFCSLLPDKTESAKPNIFSSPSDPPFNFVAFIYKPRPNIQVYPPEDPKAHPPELSEWEQRFFDAVNACTNAQILYTDEP